LAGVVVPNFHISGEDKRAKETHMYVRLKFAVLAILIGLCGAAQADILAAGPVYGGTSSVSGTVTCRIFNFGLSTVTFTARQIWTNTNVLVAPTSDTCSVPLAPTKSCAYSAAPTLNLAYSCRVVAVAAAYDRLVNISGVIEIQNSAHAVLTTVPLGK
jgi:hypothetical protein